MKKNNHIDKWVDETINSFDGAERATPKPYLFTRLTAKMQNRTENSWDNALRFLSKPAVVMACVCLVIAVNAAVLSFSNNSNTATTTEEQYAVADDYNTSVAVLNDIENIEP
jgi:uncharacterized protein (DUF1786 family)